MRLIVFALLLATALPTATGARQQAAAQEVFTAAAVVNDEVISRLDLESRLRIALLASGLPDNEESYEQITGPVLRQLVDERLQRQEAERLSIEVSEEELDAGLAAMAERNDMTAEGFVEFLRSNGASIASLRDQLRASIAWNKTLRMRVLPDVQVTEEEIDQAVQRMASQGGQVRVRLAEIFLPYVGAAEQEEAARLAERLIEQLQQGANFQQLAAQFSQTATAAAGGDTGYLPQSQLPPDIAGVVADMQPGELVGPVPSVNGFYILVLIDRQQGGGSGGGDGRLRLTQILLDAPADQEEAVMRRAEELTAGVSSCSEADTLAAQVGAPGSGDMGEVRASDMPEQLRALLLSQPIGQPSQPLLMGDTVLVLVVCEREIEGADIDRQFVAESLTRERAEMLAARYMRDLRRAANVDLRL